MKVVKLYNSQNGGEICWVNPDQIGQITEVSDGSSSVDLSSGHYCYDDRSPEALVAAIEEATK